MIKRTVVGVVAVVVLATMAGASGCQDSKGTCHPGDTRAGKGHTEVCNDHGKWTPMTKQVKP